MTRNVSTGGGAYVEGGVSTGGGDFVGGDLASSEILYERALKAIKKMYSDRSVSKEDTAINLRSLRDEIDIMLEGLGIE